MSCVSSQQVLRNSHVERIILEDGRAAGVELRGNNKRIYARKAVVSNCDMWSTSKLIPTYVRMSLHVLCIYIYMKYCYLYISLTVFGFRGLCKAFDEERDALLKETKLCASFLHLHIGMID